MEFMKQHPFAMVIGVNEFNHPVATQIPFLIKEKNGDLFLQAHMMKQTDHHKAFEKNKNVLVVVPTSGGKTFVSMIVLNSLMKKESKKIYQTFFLNSAQTKSAQIQT